MGHSSILFSYGCCLWMLVGCHRSTIAFGAQIRRFNRKKAAKIKSKQWFVTWQLRSFPCSCLIRFYHIQNYKIIVWVRISFCEQLLYWWHVDIWSLWKFTSKKVVTKALRSRQGLNPAMINKCFEEFKVLGFPAGEVGEVLRGSFGAPNDMFSHDIYDSERTHLDATVFL